MGGLAVRSEYDGGVVNLVLKLGGAGLILVGIVEAYREAYWVIVVAMIMAGVAALYTGVDRT